MAGVDLSGRRTHSVHHTREEARKAAYELAYLMNGTPAGYVFVTKPRRGKWAFVSMTVRAYNDEVDAYNRAVAAEIAAQEAAINTASQTYAVEHEGRGGRGHSKGGHDGRR